MKTSVEMDESIIVGSESESDNEMNTAAEDRNAAKMKLLSKKSVDVYEKQYNIFMQWCDEEKIGKLSEKVMLDFFSQKATKYKPSTLWATYSMLKATLLAKNNVNIGNYSKLLAYLKKKNVGNIPKTSKAFTKAEINKFLLEAPDNIYLMHKVCLIIGIAGAFHRHDLRNFSTDNVEDRNDILIIKVPNAKTGKLLTFTITDEIDDGISVLQIYRKYASLRPANITHKTFFINYRNGRCFSQVVGVHTFGKIPSNIAKFLKLSDVNCYTGHCFRRTSASFLSLNRYGWRSSREIEGSGEDSNNLKTSSNDNIEGTSTVNLQSVYVSNETADTTGNKEELEETNDEDSRRVSDTFWSDESSILQYDDELDPLTKTEPVDDDDEPNPKLEPSINFDGNSSDGMQSNNELYLNKRPQWDPKTESTKRRKTEDRDEPELDFFKSLLPDIRKMDGKQKNRLKMAVLSAINDILYSDKGQAH